MPSNRQILDDLLERQEIELLRGPLFDMAPPALPDDLDWDRVEGMMLGLAIGDALGNTTEGELPEARQRSHGEIRDYLPNRYAANRAVGVPSDDTQLAFWTLDQLVTDRGLVADHLAERFSEEPIFGIGSSVDTFLRSLKRGVRPWYRCAAHSAGNGALMRIAPVLIPHLRHPSLSLWADAALAAIVTHNDATSTSACLAWVYILWSMLAMREPPDPTWWPATYVAVAKGLEGDACLVPRGGAYPAYRGPLWRFIGEHVGPTYHEGLSVRTAANQWYSGAFLLETVPSALYVLMRYGHDPEACLVRAVNDTKDNDTVGAIVGSALGALYGVSGLPRRWIENLTGRTGANDDGRILAILEQARRAFWSAS